MRDRLMKWASALSEADDTATAIGEATRKLARHLGDVEPDLVVLFASPHHADAYEALPAGIAAAFPHALIFGCSASGVIGGGREVEERPALSLTAAVLPGVQLKPIMFDGAAPEASREEWHARVGITPDADPQFLVVVDPFSIDADALIHGLDTAPSPSP
jgi:small ligand-binding sensory domain FIST